VLGGVILQFVAAVLGVFLISLIIIRDGGTEELNYDWHGIQWSICAGIAVGLAEMISFFVSSLGVQAMQSIPIIIGNKSWWLRGRVSLRPLLSPTSGRRHSFFVSLMAVHCVLLTQHVSLSIVIGGSVMFGTVLGLCLLGEVLSYHGWLGVALLVSGICLVGTDPAASLDGH
jgi:uncharacterized membrane protein